MTSPCAQDNLMLAMLALESEYLVSSDLTGYNPHSTVHEFEHENL
jgi:hypothetical protein